MWLTVSKQKNKRRCAANIVQEAMKLPDLFGIISADLQPGVKSNSIVTFLLLVPKLT
jgi:hypothetical protein